MPRRAITRLAARVLGRWSTAERTDAAQRSELLAAEARYRQIVENARDIIFTVDTDGYCKSMNRAGDELTGLTKTPRGIHLAHLVVREHATKAATTLAKVLAGEQVPRFELEIDSREGQRLTLEVDVYPVRVDSRIVGAQGIARDVTARKVLEAQLVHAQKMEAVGRLAGGVAHDFNNLLTVIVSSAELAALDVDETSAAHRELQQIMQVAASAAALTRQLLVFSRKSVAHPTLVDINESVARFNAMLRRVVRQDIELVVKASSNAGRVRVDPTQLEQVLMNLVVNARDAMPEGGRLTIETGALTADQSFAAAHHVSAGDYSTLTVTDTGGGIAPEILVRIFEPFFTTKDANVGTGLGLATVHAIVKRAGGCIVVDSAPGKGATFTIYLPRVDSSTDDGGRDAAAGGGSATKGRTALLLVKEDEGPHGVDRPPRGPTSIRLTRDAA